jgi:hypothetical protein
MKTEEIIFLLTGIGLLVIIAFGLGNTSGKKSVCSQFKEHVLTTEGKCIKVEQESKKGAQQ